MPNRMFRHRPPEGVRDDLRTLPVGARKPHLRPKDTGHFGDHFMLRPVLISVSLLLATAVQAQKLVDPSKVSS